MTTPWKIAALFTVTAVAFMIGRCVGATGPEAAPAPTWILHVEPDVVGTAVYDDLLAALPRREGVVFVVQDEAALAKARRAWPERAVVELVVEGPLTPWARDRYTCFREDGEATCVARPRAALPEAQRGDGSVPDLLRRAGVSLAVIREPMAPVGGDTIVTRRRVFVGEHSVAQAHAVSGASEEAVIAELARIFGRPVSMLPTRALGIERLHLDMIVGHVRGSRFVVGDPALAGEIYVDGRFAHPGFGVFERARNDGLKQGADAVAASLVTAGFEVVRVPWLVSEGAGANGVPVVLTWTNAVTRGGDVLLPAYGVPTLDRAAARMWRGLGYDVVPIRCAESIVAGGAVRCLLGRLGP